MAELISDGTGISADQRFLKQWERQEDGCLLFKGDLTSDGYGLIYYRGQQRRASHVRWEIANDQSFPDDYVLRFTCGRRDCGEISHFELITRAENVRRNDVARWGDVDSRWLSCFTYDPETGCALWRDDARRLKGDPVFSVKNRCVSARRYAYELRFPGQLSKDVVLRPLCFATGYCIEPAHMEVVSRSEHACRLNADRWQKVRNRRGNL